MTVQLTIDITVSGGTVDLIVQNSSYSNLLTGVGTGVYTAEVSDSYAIVGTDFSIRASINSGAPNITVNSGRVSWIPSPVPFIGTLSYVYFNLLLPEMTQKELLQDFSIRFGQYFQEIDGTVYCKSIDDVIADTSTAKDWTSKRVNQPDQISFIPGGYGKKNYFKYKNSDINITEDYAEGIMTIANENIKDEDTFQSKFGASPTEFAGNIYLGKVNIFDGTELDALHNFTYDPGIRVMLVRDRYSYEASVRVRSDVGATTSYKVAYFDDPIQSNTCLWQQTVDVNYPLLSQALQKYKMVTREYNLTEADIQNLDFLKLIFDKDSYFLLNTVGPYVANKPCKVVMFKI